ncbi:MAG: type II toxin-antitoxin system HicA family toxin [Candidatus Nanoarchaeia archaeon]|nr:type II toxin-antitoxin system HicA family toxin [Candidatus Nanoarchaeia archaeon]MDD5357635.1 type II toxin-antitoxin system HicA family toxin [Candidatus Nanoarchaeia archaeon]MDD5588554.1 type II toxin-antitoxin system HicA family toxin [Candidatus Nanoarchaeia archaeon]
MKLGNLNSKKVLRAFIKMGMEKKAQTGTHVVITGILNGQKKTFVIPIHKKEIPNGTMTDILNNQAGISREEFFKYY